MDDWKCLRTTEYHVRLRTPPLATPHETVTDGFTSAGSVMVESENGREYLCCGKVSLEERIDDASRRIHISLLFDSNTPGT